MFVPELVIRLSGPSKRVRFHSVSGSPLKIEKRLIFHSDGVKALEECGTTNFYKTIQAHRENTDLSMILAKLDPNQVAGAVSSYSFNDLLDSPIIDVTSLPKNAGEMLNLVQTGKNLFDGLPIEIRELFNFSPEKFISSFGSKEFAEKINSLNIELNGSPVYEVGKKGKIKKINNNVVSTDSSVVSTDSSVVSTDSSVVPSDHTVKDGD